MPNKLIESGQFKKYNQMGAIMPILERRTLYKLKVFCYTNKLGLFCVQGQGMLAIC